MNKIAIAMDILRQYNENLESSGKETKIYAIDGYGERVSFKALVFGYYYVFSSIYGSVESFYGYPKDMYWNLLWGDGIIGWNRPVTNPTIDIPKALTIYTQLAASASSYKDKFTRETAFKKLFYREYTYRHNVFIDDSIQLDDAGYIQNISNALKNLDPDFYEFITNKLKDLWDLAANEAKNVSVPTKLRFLFDNRPVAKMYDALPEDESYKDGLLNMNSSVIQANQFYLTFLTSFEQIIYQYTKQTFPIKLLGTLANLYSSYVKLITNYVKPYHARLIDKAPIMRFGGGLEESVAVGDILRLDPTVQIYSDVVRWRFDNPYDYRPDEYDKLDKIWDEFWVGGKPTDSEDDEPWDGIHYYEDTEESGIVQRIEDKENYYHRIDDELLYTDNKLHQNDIYEDITITSDKAIRSSKPNLDNMPFHLYPTSLYDKYSHKWVPKDPLDPENYKVYEDLIRFGTSKEQYALMIANGMIKEGDFPLRYVLTETSQSIEDMIEYNWLNNYIENISDRDLCIITDPYTDKDIYRVTDINFKHKDYDIDISGSKIGIFTNDMNHIWVYTKDTDETFKWNLIELPVTSDIFNRIEPPNILHNKITFRGLEIDVSPFRNLSDNSTFLTDLEMPKKNFNFIKFFLFIPAHTKAILPEIEYTSRKKI